VTVDRNELVSYRNAPIFCCRTTRYYFLDKYVPGWSVLDEQQAYACTSFRAYASPSFSLRLSISQQAYASTSFQA
jgi:hypothetical protein